MDPLSKCLAAHYSIVYYDHWAFLENSLTYLSQSKLYSFSITHSIYCSSGPWKLLYFFVSLINLYCSCLETDFFPLASHLASSLKFSQIGEFGSWRENTIKSYMAPKPQKWFSQMMVHQYFWKVYQTDSLAPLHFLIQQADGVWKWESIAEVCAFVKKPHWDVLSLRKKINQRP